MAPAFLGPDRADLKLIVEVESERTDRGMDVDRDRVTAGQVESLRVDGEREVVMGHIEGGIGIARLVRGPRPRVRRDLVLGRPVEEADALRVEGAEGQGERAETAALEDDGCVTKSGEQPPGRSGHRRVEDERVGLVALEELGGPAQPRNALRILDELAGLEGSIQVRGMKPQERPRHLVLEDLALREDLHLAPLGRRPRLERDPALAHEDQGRGPGFLGIEEERALVHLQGEIFEFDGLPGGHEARVVEDQVDEAIEAVEGLLRGDSPTRGSLCPGQVPLLDRASGFGDLCQRPEGQRGLTIGARRGRFAGERDLARGEHPPQLGLLGGLVLGLRELPGLECGRNVLLAKGLFEGADGLGEGGIDCGLSGSVR